MKRLFDLQLFAAENVGTDGVAATDAPGSAKEQAESAPKEKEEEQQPETPPKETAAKYTDKDVDEILNRKFAEWQKKQQKAVDEAKKLAEMDATQKAEYQRDQLQKELDELKRASALAEMSKTARKMLSDSGINISDDLLSVMVTTDAEETKAAIDGFSQMFSDAVEAAVKERLKGEPPRKGSGGTATITKEQIGKIKDHELRQQKMLENRELYNF
jgi:hypothetical protein|nr:MAG TPA: capsid scaffolding protein [Caudoviricetes sp.]